MATGRYSTPRILIDWGRNDWLRILKMLAWVIYDREGVRNAPRLERRVEALYEEVVHSILGQENVSLQSVKEHTFAEQGAHITAAKLLARADRTERYFEFNGMEDEVEEAYERITEAPKELTNAPVS